MEEKTLIWKKSTWMSIYPYYQRLLEYLTHDVKYVATLLLCVLMSKLLLLSPFISIGFYYYHKHIIIKYISKLEYCIVSFSILQHTRAFLPFHINFLHTLHPPFFILIIQIFFILSSTRSHVWVLVILQK